MEFHDYSQLIRGQFAKMVAGKSTIFVSNVPPGQLWNTYLNSFAPNDNEIYRQRRSHDCSCCRHFIEHFGALVTIDPETFKVETLWDFAITGKYAPSTKALSALVASAGIKGIFVSQVRLLGTATSSEVMTTKQPDGTTKEYVHTWNHFNLTLPDRFVARLTRVETEDGLRAKAKEKHDLLETSLSAIDPDATETVLDLIATNSLYRGDQFEGLIETFWNLQMAWKNLDKENRDSFLWLSSNDAGPLVSSIKNRAIGQLLLDLSIGVDINEAVRRFEYIVGDGYQRSEPVYTEKMKQEAKKTATELGVIDALHRRFARLSDIDISNVIWANRDAVIEIGEYDDPFADLSPNKSAISRKRTWDGIKDISYTEFLANVVPRSRAIELFVEQDHGKNFVSLIAPRNSGGNPLTQWDNGYTWAYRGNLAAASMTKKHVEQLGGKTNGVLRCSFIWNQDRNSNDDLDAWVTEPDGNRIWFRKPVSKTGGNLDVDIRHPMDQKGPAVENITWPNLLRMHEGTYEFKINQFSYRGGRGGFVAEIACGDKLWQFECKNDCILTDDTVKVAIFNFSRERGVEMVQTFLPELTTPASNIWGISTNSFAPVNVILNSPNCWDNGCIGTRHLIFGLQNAICDERPNGFFVEFLPKSLRPHRKVFEALSFAMAVEDSPDQISGLGFPVTRQDSVVVKVVQHASTSVMRVRF